MVDPHPTPTGIVVLSCVRHGSAIRLLARSIKEVSHMSAGLYGLLSLVAGGCVAFGLVACLLTGLLARKTKYESFVFLAITIGGLVALYFLNRATGWVFWQF